VRSYIKNKDAHWKKLEMRAEGEKKMQIVTKQISVSITKEEQNKLFDLARKIRDTYVCECISCDECSSEICNKDICPFYKLDDELRAVMDKIFKAARDYGPKEGAE
jgi:predicted aldo/keto reductase-like oxidoreductase